MTEPRPITASDALGFTFTEVMAGHVAQAATDFKSGARDGRRADSSFWFRGVVTIPDLTAFLDDPQHRGVLSGMAGGSLLGGRELPFAGGEIALFAPTPAGRVEMQYRFALETEDGRLLVDGFKDVHNDFVVDVWTDTTRLFTTITGEGAEDSRWKGVLTITPRRLVPQVLSFRGLGARRPWHHPQAIGRFLWFFSSAVGREYFLPRRRARSDAGR